MKWQPVKGSYRLFLGFLGIIGALLFAFLLSDLSLLKEQPRETFVYLAMAALGNLLFLFAAFVGKFPEFPGHPGNEPSQK